jgi:hypothetical protein
MKPRHPAPADPGPDEVQPYGELEARWRAEGQLSPVATITGCEAKWHWLVEQVEVGYDDMREEWENDLDSRLIVQRAIDELPEGLGERLAKRVRPWDERFRAATTPVARPYWRGGWWTDRVPLKMGPILTLDLVEFLE